VGGQRPISGAVYLFGAAGAERDAAVGGVPPAVSTDALPAFLDQLGEQAARSSSSLG
jgi:hypothetical protein